MTLSASDELRHAPTDDVLWRESVYWNFFDPDRKLGAWIYTWVLPNQNETGLIVSFYSGSWADEDIFAQAMAAPGHRLVDGDRWIYAVQQVVATATADDFDDFTVGGLHLRRLDPLGRYQLTWDDGGAGRFEFESRFMTAPYDYADGYNATPPWLGTNRYHRNHWMTGVLEIGGERLAIDCTGDSDHSWGVRDWEAFSQSPFKMWSFQSDDGRLAASVLQQGVGGVDVALGYLSIDGDMASAAQVESRAGFDERGVQRDIELTVTDEKGRVVRARLAAMAANIGWGTRETFWGFEGVGEYQVEGYGRMAGVSSYFWPARVTPAILASGGAS